MKKVVAALFLAAAVTMNVSSIYAEDSFLDGLTIGGGITLNLQNLQNSNYVKGEDDELDENKNPTLGSYSIDLEIEKAFDDNNTAFLHLETGKGNINKYLNSVAEINRDADDSNNGVSITEAWFEHKFNDKFALSAGILDPTVSLDDNAYANDETAQFIGGMFRNASNINFGDNAFGVKATYETDLADIAVQYLDASNDGTIDEDSGDITRNAFASAQVNFKLSLIDEMEGNYRIYGWTNTNDNVKLGDPNSKTEKDYGFGVSLDQQISDVFGAFARYSWSRGNVGDYNTADSEYEAVGAAHTWSIGAQATVKGLGDEDVVAVAYGQVIPSDEYKDYIDRDAKSENHLEVYYSWNIADYLSITPSFQMVENPFYNDNANTAYVGSLRMQISF